MNGFYLRKHNGTILGKARLFGIAKEKYVNQVPSYNAHYVTEFDSEVIKHPEVEEYALKMFSLDGLPDALLASVETGLDNEWIPFV